MVNGPFRGAGTVPRGLQHPVDVHFHKDEGCSGTDHLNDALTGVVLFPRPRTCVDGGHVGLTLEVTVATDHVSVGTGVVGGNQKLIDGVLGERHVTVDEH